MKNIFQSIADIIEDCPAIGKNSKNTQQNFMFRGIDAVMNVFQPLLAKHRVFVVPEVLDSMREERQTRNGGNLIYTVLKVKYTFYAEDGSNVVAIVQGEGMDSADKGSNKAMSIAFKYALFQVFCIPTEEMRDPDAESFEPSDAVYCCEECGKTFKQYTANGRTWTPKQQYDRLKAAADDGKARCKECRDKKEA